MRSLRERIICPCVLQLVSYPKPLDGFNGACCCRVWSEFQFGPQKFYFSWRKIKC